MALTRRVGAALLWSSRCALRRPSFSRLSPAPALALALGRASASSPDARQWHPARHFCAGSDFALVQLLRDEIAEEKEADALSIEEGKKKPPPPFTISDKPGVQEVYLRRSFGEEDISIACYYHSENDPQEGADGQNEEDPHHMVQMTINIKKGGDDPYLQIICCCYGEEPVIHSLSYKQNGFSPQELIYEGPHFSDLDNNMKGSLLKYLFIRGIDAQLGDFILHYMYHKEQREYSRWLRNIEVFLNK